MVSATQGTGLDVVDRFLRQDHTPRPSAMLPVLQDLPQCRKWASQVGNRVDYQQHLPSAWSRRLDDIFLHKLWGPSFL
jgi:ferrous iron transport protein B